MYVIRNNLTGRSYLLLSAVSVQEDADCSPFSTKIEGIQPEYTHGVLLYCLDTQTVLAVPYHILHTEYYDKEKDADRPLWDLNPKTDNTDTPLHAWDQGRVQYAMDQSAESEADCLRAWLISGRFYAPLVACGIYIHKTDHRKNALQLPQNGMFDKSNNSDNSSVFMFELDAGGRVQRPVWVSLEELFTDYQLVVNGKEPTTMSTTNLDELFSLSPSSQLDETENGSSDIADVQVHNVERALGLMPLSVYYCAKDKMEYIYIQMVQAKAFGDTTMLALFMPRSHEEDEGVPFPVVGMLVDSTKLSQAKEHLFEHKDYGDGIRRPYLTYIGQVVATSIEPVAGLVRRSN